MSSHIVLESAEDVIELVTNWHTNNLYVIQKRLEQSDCLQELAVLQQVLAVIEELPFDTLYISKES